MTPPTIAADVPHRLPDTPVHITTTENRTVHMTTTAYAPDMTTTENRTVQDMTTTELVPDMTTTELVPETTTTELVPDTTTTELVPETTTTELVPETTTTAAAPAPPLVPLPVARIRPSRAEHIAPVAVPPPRVTPVLPAQAVSGARAHAQRMFPPAAVLAPPRAAAPAPPRAAALAPPPPVHSAADEAAVAA